MAQMKCPKCGAATLPAMGRFYCARCGWNRDAAERRLVRVQWLVPALIVIFDVMGIIALGMERHNWPGAVLFATLPTLLLGFVYAGARQGLTKLRASTGTAASGNDTPSLAAVAETSSGREKSGRYDFLASLPLPRPVRLNRRGKRVVNLLLLFVFGMEAFLAWTLHGVWYRDPLMPQSRGPEIFLVAFMALIASLPFFMRRGMVRDLKLMQNGALAMARVTEQREFRNASAVTYEFQDGTGKIVSASANDLTRTFSTGMTIPVFYDSQNAKRNVAACASFLEVVDPSDE
ncbi:MAG: hypothetical protein WA876_12950 [Candidatus Acidiferrales bacterium]